MIHLKIRCRIPPSFKNRKHSGKNGFVYCEPKIKERMRQLEDDILFALYSYAATNGSGTVLECLKALRTALCGLSDDSVQVIPQHAWSAVTVPPSDEGIEIYIEEIK